MAEGGEDLSDPNGNPSLEPIIAGIATLAEADQVSQNFENTTVNVVAGDQTNISFVEHHYHVQHSESPGFKSTNDHAKLDAENGFLVKTKLHLRKEIGDSQRFSGHPTIMVIDMMESDARRSQSITGNPFGRDVEKIRLDQIHDPRHDKCPNHVTILGEAGAGKTTLSKSYCLAVSEGNVKTLKNIQLVHFVQAATLQHRSTTTAFNLLFTEQMAHDPDTELSLQEQEAGQQWLKNNSAKMLIVIDGLDQCLEVFGHEKYPRVTSATFVKANDIIANIMSKNIWRDARVLTTTRWNTYWDIKADEKPEKVVGLRGLDDNTLRQIAFSDSIDGDTMLNTLKASPPKFLSLCRNPMFFNYTTTLFKKDPSSIPDNLSGLMSAFFRACLRPSSEKHYDDITRLAYNAMRGNIFVFPQSYLRKYDVDANVLNNFLSTGAVLEDAQDTPTPFDKFSQFSHQTMQEFFCALHVVNLTRDEIKEFVTNQLNDGRMQLTRQLLYGLVLNDNVMRPMRKYLANRTTSIQECRGILMEYLHGLIANGTIRDMEIINLLRDCGDETIREIKQNVHRIEINHPGMLNGHIVLATMVKRLSPLQEVYCDHFYLEPPVIDHFIRILSYVPIFQVRTMAITDTSLTGKNLIGYLILFRLFRSNELLLNECNLTKEIDVMIAHVWKGLDIQIDVLSVIDVLMNTYGYEVLAHIATVSKCKELQIQMCLLTKTKLQGLWRGCRNHGTQLPNITIIDPWMEEDVYEELTRVVKLTSCSELVFQECRLTRTKLRGFLRGCRNQNIRLSSLVILDGSMKEDDYEQLAHILKLVCCKNLDLVNSSLTEAKLCGLIRGCRNQTFELGKLFISNPSMQSDVYYHVAEVLKVTKCPDMQFGECNLSKQDLECFGTGCRENQVILNILGVHDESINEDGYEVLAQIAKFSKCQELHLKKCCLTKRKMQGLLRGCRNHGTQLHKILIIDESMQEDGYEELAHIVKLSGCSILELQQCSLSSSKLLGLLRGCSNHNTQIQTLAIFDESMNEDEYQLLANVLKVVLCQMLQLFGCCLSKTKLRGLWRGCGKQKLWLGQLSISDPDMPSDAYCKITEILKVTNCASMQFRGCNLSTQDLQCFRAGCRENQVTLQDLTIAETYSVANHADVSALCDLMIFAVVTLSIHCWGIDYEGIRRLEDTLHRRDSKTLLLLLPDELYRVKRIRLFKNIAKITKTCK